MQDLISVIIPVYKVESYLHACIESVLSQSYSNLEVILVDDGSPDDCPAICDHYAEKDARVRVIHKSNGGASSARNAGIAAAKGSYISFVDSDDVMVSDGLALLHSAMERTHAKYSAGICKILNSTACKNRISEEIYIEFEREPDKILKYMTQAGSYSPYAKLYRADVIRTHHLRFDESLQCSEDALFVRQYLSYCPNMVLVPHVVYEYNTSNDQSLSKKGYEMYCEYYVEKLKVLKQFCSKLPISEQDKQWFLSYRAVHGLRISTNHYLEHWNSPEERVQLINKSIVLLSPWVDVSGAAIAAMDVRTATWWKNKRELIGDLRVDEYYACVMRESEKKCGKIHIIARMKWKIKEWMDR